MPHQAKKVAKWASVCLFKLSYQYICAAYPEIIEAVKVAARR
jgi:hypothetical protein